MNVHLLFAERRDSFVQLFNFVLQLALMVLDLHRLHGQRQSQDLFLSLLTGLSEIVKSSLSLLLRHQAGSGRTFGLFSFHRLESRLLFLLFFSLDKVGRHLPITLVLFLINRLGCGLSHGLLLGLIFFHEVAGSLLGTLGRRLQVLLALAVLSA